MVPLMMAGSGGCESATICVAESELL